MKIDRFTTPTWSGTFKISDSIIKEYNKWVLFEKTLDEKGAEYSTTQNGWQYIFKQTDKEPFWLEQLKPEINKIREEIGCIRVKTIWTVEYNSGGYQDPHFHNIGIATVLTVVINLSGNGELLLHDPRPIAQAQGWGFADIVTLNPGDWIAFPSYITHNSRPSSNKRNILVLDVYAEEPWLKQTNLK